MADASLVYDIDSAAALKAAKDLRAMDSAAAKAAGSADRLGRASGGASSNFAGYAKSLSEVRTSLPGFNISADAAAAALARQRSAALQAAGGIDALANGMASASNQARNYASNMRGVNNIQSSVGNQFAQLNDVVVTAWGGMNPALIGMQQGMQMVQGFAGQTLPQALGTLGGAFAQLLNPVTLVTVGVVAAGSALIQWGISLFSATEQTAKASETIGSLANAYDALRLATEAANQASWQLVGNYGVQNEAALRLLQTKKALAEVEVMIQMQAAQAQFASQFGGLADAVADADAALSAYRREITDMSVDLATAAQYQDVYRVSVAVLRDEFNLTHTQGGRLVDVINEIGSAKGPVEQSEAMKKFADEIIRAHDEGAKIPPEMLRTAQEAIKASQAALMLAGNLDVAAAAASRIKIDPFGQTAYDPSALAGMSAADLLPTRAQLGLDIPKRGRSGGGGAGGGGGAAIKQAEKQFQTLRELLEKETVFQFAEYEKRQAQLVAALDKQVITHEQYAQMEQDLKTYYFGMDYERRALEYEMSLEQLRQALEAEYITRQEYNAKTAALQWEYTNAALDLNSTTLGAHLNGLSDYFGQANSLAGGGYASLLKAQKTFAAASAFVAAYQGASLALTDQNLTTWQRIAAAAKVLTTGLGFVNAIKSGGGAGGGGSARSAATSTAPAAAPAQAEKTTIIRLSGDGYFTDFVGGLMEEIYKQSKDGRVIIAGYNT